MAAFYQSLPSSLFAGVIVSILEILFIYVLLGKLLQRAENKRWEKSRRELCARVLFYAHSLSGPLAHFVRCDGDAVYVTQDVDSALQHIKEISHRFDVLVSHYSGAITAEWFVNISVTADELRCVSVCADIALSHWDNSYAATEREDRTQARLTLCDDAWVQPLGNPSAQNTTYKLPERPGERQRSILGQHLYICCDQIAQLSAEMSSFATTLYDSGDLRDTECFSRKTYWRYGSNVEKHINRIDRDVRCLQTCADQISAGRLYLPRTN